MFHGYIRSGLVQCSSLVSDLVHVPRIHSHAHARTHSRTHAARPPSLYTSTNIIILILKEKGYLGTLGHRLSMYIGLRAQSLGFRVQGLGFRNSWAQTFHIHRAQGLWLMAQGLGFRVQGLGILGHQLSIYIGLPSYDIPLCTMTRSTRSKEEEDTCSYQGGGYMLI